MNTRRQHRSERRGMALVVVLSILVLLTGLVVAFFVQAMAYRNLSNSSLNDLKSDLLAQSALQIVVADLKSEIENGSTPTQIGNELLYIPNSPADTVPRRSGSPVGAGGEDVVPNLIRRSVRGDAIASPGVASRASAVSTNDPALNRRYIANERWNKHYLIPRDASYAATAVGTKPVAEFEAPDWVYMTEQGPEVLSVGTKDVIGRYAYAVYDEGGLLDMNVAGYPSAVPARDAHPSPDPENLMFWGSGDKRSVAFADLQVLGLTPDEVDQIVGWRTYATSQPQGSFPELAFDEAAAARFYDMVANHPNGFLTTTGNTVSSGGSVLTDQMFTSRQQLLKFRDQIGFTPDALQYMGTFSRSRNQPGFVPDPDRPKVQAGQTSNHSVFGRGNDAYGQDRETDPAEDINPPMRLVRVTKEFTRRDGTEAKEGDPLVKSRFALSRLAQVLHTATASKDESDPIYRDFGLYRSSANDPWKYDHGNADGILRLHEVAELGREPDFFELLKAAINVGSLAKPTAPPYYTATGSSANVAYVNSRLSALHALEIGANIIDQYDSDGFPTRIEFASHPDKQISGVEDLPYIYNLRNRPAIPSAPVCRWLVQPVLWNPHDPDSGEATDRPTEFRIRAESQDPAQVGKFQVSYLQGNSPMEFDFEWDLAGSPHGPLTFRAGESEGYYGFRQPTRLGEANVPAGTQASGNDFNQPDVDSGTTLIGLVACEYLMKVPRTSDPSKDAYASKVNITSSTYGVNFILEYRDGGQWIEYDSFPAIWSNSGIKMFSTSVDTDEEMIDEYNKYFAHSGVTKAIDVQAWGETRWWGTSRTDPRTQRWGSSIAQYINFMEQLDPANNIYGTYREGTDIGFGDHHTSMNDNGFVGERSSYTGGPGNLFMYRGLQHAYWQENSVRETQQGPSEASHERRRFLRDADGIVRRAMGGYATDPASGGSFSNELGLPMVTENFGSRPLILNRPFQSVAELGYVYRGEPWKNINFSVPESGDSALLDLFCLEEPVNDDGLIAGNVNLNTRQAPVLQAILSGAILNTTNPGGAISDAEAAELAEALVERTTDMEAANRRGPLTNLADLVGRWDPEASADVATTVDPEQHYSGFTTDIGSVTGFSGTAKALIPRQREAAIRALAGSGDVGTWNLMIDVVAQTGRFTEEGADLADFVVEGEKRYWLHIAIDRLTGEVIDQQMEVVME